MDTLIRQGKVLYWGTSEWPVALIREAAKIAQRHHLHGPSMEQPQYNLLHRERVEKEYARLYSDIGLGTTTARPEDVDRWEDKLGRLNYEAGKRSHIKLFWPRDLSARLYVAEASVWHLCPAKVYECHLDSSGSVRLVVNYAELHQVRKLLAC